MKRRHLLTQAAIGATAATTIAPPQVIASPKIQWRLVSTWPPKLPIFQTGLERFARRVNDLSDGQMSIEVFAGNELVPAFGVFDAVSKGSFEAGAGVAYYWSQQSIAGQWFGAVPFGLNAQGMNSWLYSGGGLQLWEETYAPFNLIPRPYGNTGIQMGGWFNKEIRSVRDFQGLRMRIPGLGGKVISKLGGVPVLLPGGDILSALQQGNIEAAEWVGPMHDLILGLYQAARYYYTPGWHDPGTTIEVFFNKTAYQKLPKTLQAVLDMAAAESNLWMLAEFDAHNGAALETLLTQHHVKLRRFPDSVLESLREKSSEVREEEAAKDPLAQKVHQAFNRFQEKIEIWGAISERSYFTNIAQKFKL